MQAKDPRESFELRYPPLVLFGWGKRAALPAALREITGNTRVPGVFLVCTHSAARDPGLDFWRGLCEGRIVAEHVGVPHDPPLATVDRLAAEARDSGAEAVVAVGGGSVMDAAKAAAVLATADVGITAWFEGRWTPKHPGLPAVALPTTAGTGAEITRNAVLTDPDRKVKRSVRAPFMVPRVAICDPELTLTMPPELTAASGLDALTQAIESHVSNRGNAVTRALAAQAVKLLLDRLPAACRDGADVDARTAVAKASLLAALSFSQGALGAAHGLGHPIGALLDLPHGLTCGILLPHVLAWNAPECMDRIAELAAASGHPSPEAFIARVRSLVAEVGLPPDFRELGLERGHFRHITANCRSGSMRANPRPMSDRDIEEFLTPLARA